MVAQNCSSSVLKFALSPAGLSIELCDQGRVEFIEEATHWVQHEEPERVNRLLLEFLQEKKMAAGDEPSS